MLIVSTWNATNLSSPVTFFISFNCAHDTIFLVFSSKTFSTSRDINALMTHNSHTTVSLSYFLRIRRVKQQFTHNLVHPTFSSNTTKIWSRVRVSAPSWPSPPLYPHFNWPSGFWPCVKSCLVGGSDKYYDKDMSQQRICKDTDAIKYIKPRKRNTSQHGPNTRHVRQITLAKQFKPSVLGYNQQRTVLRNTLYAQRIPKRRNYFPHWHIHQHSSPQSQ